MSRVPLAINLPPVPGDTQVAGRDGRFPLAWLAWFRALWQRVNEPWKFNPNYAGEATLLAGTISVSSLVIRATSKVTLTAQTNTGTPGFLSLGTIVPGSSFVINSTSATDTRTVFWQIWESL